MSLEITRNKIGQFTTGNNSGQRFTRETSLGNQNAKGNPPNKTTFKVGDNVLEKHPSWKGGIQYNRNDCAYVVTGTNKRMRRPRYEWEKHYGPIPDGYIVWHIDGNKKNDDIGNLELITRGECAIRNKLLAK